MPFTISHAAAVLPLGRTRLPMSALVTGALAPDLPYYLPLPVASAHTHGPAGIATDMALGAAALVLYRWVARAPVLALAGRTPQPSGPHPGTLATMRYGAHVIAALAIGACTHMAWDSFTQLNGAAVRAWPVLSTPVVGPHLLFNVLMYASSAVGLAVVAWWLIRAARAGDGADSTPAAGTRPLRRGERVAAVVLIACCAVAGALLLGAGAAEAPSVYDAVRGPLLGLVGGTAAGLACYTAVWWVGRALGGASARRSGPHVPPSAHAGRQDGLRR